MRIAEIRGSPNILYHGTSKKFLSDIIHDGLIPPSSWGEKWKAQNYADEFNDGIIIGVPISRFDSSLLKPNENFIDYYRENDPDLYDEWISSEQGVEDSLRLFDSIVYHDVLQITKADIIK